MSAVLVTRFRCNGLPRESKGRSDRLLIEVLREELGLTGTKLGCGTGDCGACTVLIDGLPVNSCLVYAVECADSQVTTVEGIASEPVGQQLVEALAGGRAIQCGICTPGFLVSAYALVEARTGEHVAVDRETIEEALAGNLCRCTGYYPIIDAVRAVMANLATRPSV